MFQASLRGILPRQSVVILMCTAVDRYISVRYPRVNEKCYTNKVTFPKFILNQKNNLLKKLKYCVFIIGLFSDLHADNLPFLNIIFFNIRYTRHIAARILFQQFWPAGLWYFIRETQFSDIVSVHVLLSSNHAFHVLLWFLVSFQLQKMFFKFDT